ncbi:MAG TPA: TIGR04282 family arsenosugar biosynthesis glycosyltransferase [Candidatus Acidoferrales bacterium]|nr:TIGR04282 family arsenosugar biosynthesis glycosyltransferase [Candidatus Acidoferrales bacterium]
MSTLVIMARYPAAGEVKTRLAGRFGAQGACDLYRAFIEDLSARFANQPRRLIWMYHPPERDFAALLPGSARCLPQRGADLGERMHNCFRQLCHQDSPVIMIGADVPHIRDEWIDEAEQSSRDNDVVLGPSADGGYYLIAMRQAHDVFRGIEMGTPNVHSQTVAKAADQNLRVHLLPACFDIDEPDDVRRLQGQLDSDPTSPRLPATSTVLQRLC